MVRQQNICNFASMTAALEAQIGDGTRGEGEG
jgi:hypothetical protein